MLGKRINTQKVCIKTYKIMFDIYLNQYVFIFRMLSILQKLSEYIYKYMKELS